MKHLFILFILVCTSLFGENDFYIGSCEVESYSYLEKECFKNFKPSTSNKDNYIHRIDSIDSHIDDYYFFPQHIITTYFNDSGVGFHVYDRFTYKHLFKYEIIDHIDGDYEDHINNIELHDGNYYILVTHRYEGWKDKDRTSLIVLKSQPLVKSHLYTVKTISKSSYIPNGKFIKSHSDGCKFHSNDLFENVLPNFSIETSYSKEYTIYKGSETNCTTRIKPFLGEGEVSKSIAINEHQAILISNTSDIWTSGTAQQLIYLVNIDKNTYEKLFNVELQYLKNNTNEFSNNISNIVYFENKIAFGVNQDLCIMDLKTKKIQIYKNVVNTNLSKEYNHIEFIKFDPIFKRLLVFSYLSLDNFFIDLKDLAFKLEDDK